MTPAEAMAVNARAAAGDDGASLVMLRWLRKERQRATAAAGLRIDALRHAALAALAQRLRQERPPPSIDVHRFVRSDGRTHLVVSTDWGRVDMARMIDVAGCPVRLDQLYCAGQLELLDRGGRWTVVEVDMVGRLLRAQADG